MLSETAGLHCSLTYQLVFSLRPKLFAVARYAGCEDPWTYLPGVTLRSTPGFTLSPATAGWETTGLLCGLFRRAWAVPQSGSRYRARDSNYGDRRPLERLRRQ